MVGFQRVDPMIELHVVVVVVHAAWGSTHGPVDEHPFNPSEPSNYELS